VLCVGDMYGQASAVFAIIKKAIEELGGSMDNVISTRAHNLLDCVHSKIFREITLSQIVLLALFQTANLSANPRALL
jgi:hypothetical protein